MRSRPAVQQAAGLLRQAVGMKIADYVTSILTTRARAKTVLWFVLLRSRCVVVVWLAYAGKYACVLVLSLSLALCISCLTAVQCCSAYSRSCMLLYVYYIII